jgi:hypothetical protein
VDDVHRLGGPIAGHLALVTPDTDAFRFDASSAPSLPPSATTDRIGITLSHPASDIRTLRTRTPPNPGQCLALAPLWYDYWPQQPCKHPWDGEHVDPWEMWGTRSPRKAGGVGAAGLG